MFYFKANLAILYYLNHFFGRVKDVAALTHIHDRFRKYDAMLEQEPAKKNEMFLALIDLRKQFQKDVDEFKKIREKNPEHLEAINNLEKESEKFYEQDEDKVHQIVGNRLLAILKRKYKWN